MELPPNGGVLGYRRVEAYVMEGMYHPEPVGYVFIILFAGIFIGYVIGYIRRALQ